MRNEELGLLRQLAAPPKPKMSLVERLTALRAGTIKFPAEGIGQLMQPYGDDDDD